MNVPHKPFSFLWFVVNKNRLLLWGALSAVLVASIIGEGLHIVLKHLLDAATGEVSPATLWFWAIAYPVLYFIGENFWRLSGFIGMKLITKSEALASKYLFDYLIEHSITYFNNRFAGSLVNKVGHASKSLHNLISNSLWQFIPLIIQLSIDIVIVFFIHHYLGLILSAWSLIFITLNFIFVRRKQHLSYAAAQASSVMKGKMVDSVSNIAVVQASAQHEFERRFVNKFIWKNQESQVRSWFASEWILFMNGILLTFFILAMIVVTLILVKAGLATIGSLVLVVTMSISLQSALFFIGSKMTDAIDDYSQLSEGLSELVIPYDIEDRPEAAHMKNSGGSICFTDVSFNYDNKKVFSHFSLEIKPGEKVGIVGVSGAGKSTLVNLLLRHFDIDEGEIKIDGVDIREITRSSLRSHVAFVPQDVSLFHRSIMDNIRYGRQSATDEEVIEAAKKAQAHDFISSFPKGYDTYVGERGVKVSGGQRQRIAIARAFLKNAPILILDEATSSLDSESELMVQAALEKLMSGKTVLAIAHRLSTLQIMDRIIVLEDGKVVEDGTHKELMDHNGRYAKLWAHQVSGFLGEEQ